MATTQVETVNTGADKAKLAAAVALVIASVAGFFDHIQVAGAVGIEPTTFGFGDRRSAN